MGVHNTARRLIEKDNAHFPLSSTPECRTVYSDSQGTTSKRS